MDLTYDRIFFNCGRPWHIRRANMDELWDAMGKSPNPEEEQIPYWNEVWPSSLALAGWLAEMQDDINGKPCLDMGCGLGFTALVGRWLGADVCGMDYSKDAIDYARQNEKFNELEGVDWQVMDWGKPTCAPESFHRIWAGDIMYEEAFAHPIAEFIHFALRKGGKAWISEPGREVFGHLLKVLPEHKLGYKKICSLPVIPLTQQESSVPVTIWELYK